MWRSADIVRVFFVFEDMRLALEGEAEALDAGGYEADYDPKLFVAPRSTISKAASHLWERRLGVS